MTFRLNADPTFLATVKIPKAGTKPEAINFTFKHRKKGEFDAFLKGAKDLPDVDYIFEIALGWDLDDEFNRENVARLLENYHGAAQAITLTYVSELSGTSLS